MDGFEITTEQYLSQSGGPNGEVEPIDPSEWDAAFLPVYMTAAERDDFDRSLWLGRLVDMANDFAGRRAA